ncbi:MAG: methyltransferase domain-containing protein [Burkholderiales bacterium]|nr:methyltransferase domain-containing protein [Anaerolineae bacterium]
MASQGRDNVLNSLERHFTNRVEEYGASHGAVDWGSTFRQQLAFRQMLRILENPATAEIAQGFSLLDYGCGYGALLPYLKQRGFNFGAYTGYDMVVAMIDSARNTFSEIADSTFTTDEPNLTPVDYVIGSGLISLRLDNEAAAWGEHVLRMLDRLWSLSAKGLAFNSLTSYSDTDKMRADLYYPDPRMLFDYCKTHFSKQVALLHDYGVYEFTILVRREP